MGPALDCRRLPARVSLAIRACRSPHTHAAPFATGPATGSSTDSSNTGGHDGANRRGHCRRTQPGTWTPEPRAPIVPSHMLAAFAAAALVTGQVRVTVELVEYYTQKPLVGAQVTLIEDAPDAAQPR